MVGGSQAEGYILKSFLKANIILMIKLSLTSSSYQSVSGLCLSQSWLSMYKLRSFKSTYEQDISKEET